MSIADKITRLTSARNNIRTSLVNKGISAGEHGFESFANDISGIADKTAFIKAITRNGLDFSSFFYGRSFLTDIPEIDTSSAAYFTSMFVNCTGLVTAPELDTSNGKYFQSMFNSCSALSFVPNYDTSKGETFKAMFYGCTSLVEAPELDTSNATNVEGMFSRCTSLETVPTIDISRATNVNDIFYNCSSLKNITFANNCINASISFAQSPKLTAYSIISIANGLNANAQTHTLKVDVQTDEWISSIITGRVEDGIFISDPSGGGIPLLNFIQQNKHWIVTIY